MKKNFLCIVKKIFVFAIILTAILSFSKIDKVSAVEDNNDYNDGNNQSVEEVEQSLSQIIEQLLSGLDLTTLQSFFDECSDIFSSNISLNELIDNSCNSTG